MTTPQLEQNVVALLRQLDLAEYVELFERNNIDNTVLLDLGEADLEKLGVSSLGHRRKILQGIENLKSARLEHTQAEENKLSQEANRNALTQALWTTGLIGAVAGIGFSLIVYDESGFLGVLIMPVVAVFASWIYFAPTLIAFRKGHNYRWAIAIANLFFAGTGVVWVILLVFSLMLINPEAATVLGAAGMLTRRR